MSFSCCCANPDCMANGCARMRQTGSNDQWGRPRYSFTPNPPPPLSADTIRKIIREELDKRG